MPEKQPKKKEMAPEEAMPKAPNQTPEPVDTPKKSKSSRSLGVMFGGGVVVVLILALLGGYVFVRSQVQSQSEHPTVVTWAEVFNIPVASVNGESISYASYVENKQTLEQFYQNAPEGFAAVNDEQLSEMTISRLVANTLVAQIAGDLGVQVTQEDIEAKKQELLQNFENEEDARTQIEQTYGWTFEQYIDEVIRPLVLEEKLSEAVRSGEANIGEGYQTKEVKARHILFRVQEDENPEVVRQHAQDILQRIEQGENFEELAKEFGGDGTAEEGGDLGWFGRGVMVPEFEQAVFELAPGEVADELVQTEFGYHIVKVDDTRDAQDFTAFMEQKLQEAQIEMKADIPNPFDQQQAQQGE